MEMQSWTDVIAQSLQDLWLGVVSYIPEILGALVVFVLGLVVAVILGRVVTKVVKTLKVDQLLDKTGFKKALDKTDLEIEASGVLGELVKWFFIIAFLMAATEILNLQQITSFLEKIFFYIPQLVVAVVILIAAILIANVLKKVVRASMEAADLGGADFIGALTRWGVLVFGALAALSQLGIAYSMIQTLFTGLVGALAISLGLAFGLGGREVAQEVIDKAKRNILKK